MITKQKPIIRVADGLLEGISGRRHFQVLCVPYAVPPVVNYGWCPPQPLEPWDRRKADRFGPIAYQLRPPGPLDDERMPVESEDCLY